MASQARTAASRLGRPSDRRHRRHRWLSGSRVSTGSTHGSGRGFDKLNPRFGSRVSTGSTHGVADRSAELCALDPLQVLGCDGARDVVTREAAHLEVGDEITLETPIGSCTYEVNQPPFPVSPTQLEVVANTPEEATLTLTTCHPKGSARERLIVKATLVRSDVQQPTAGEPS